ncbi:MAG: hypothetical protein U9P49_03870, partial [Thermodesulfobacteriota bacterium]|nr:hypothetical protein [Thermodesulfobacteriota bacterium]
RCVFDNIHGFHHTLRKAVRQAGCPRNLLISLNKLAVKSCLPGPLQEVNKGGYVAHAYRCKKRTSGPL